jgi:hypothetical protein
MSALAVAAGTAGLLLLGPPASACGCGGVVSDQGTRTTVNREVALITRDGGTESITMQLSMDSTGADVGLLVPTPTPAKVSLGETQTFTDLEAVTRPRRVEQFHLFGPPALIDPGRSSGDTAGAAPGSGVTALETVDLGPLAATTLQADDPRALQSWLDEHHYVLRDRLSTQVQPYIDEGWSFVAVRLTQQGKDIRGTLPPVVMTFASGRTVYPMRMSRAAADAQTVRTYLLDSHRQQRDDATARVGLPAVVFAGSINPTDVRSASLAKSLATTPYLTVIDQYFADPATQISSDFAFVPAPTDEQVIPTYTVDTYGIPIDVAILLLLVLTAAAVVVSRMVSRRRTGHHPSPAN